MVAREEIQSITEQFLAAFNKGDPVPFLNTLDDDLEAFDHAAYRFDSKPSFVAYLQSLLAPAEAMSWVYHQPSYRTFNDDAGVVNAHDMFTMVPRGGGAPTFLYSRTTLMYAKKGGQWKIVNVNISPLPKE